MSKILDRRAKVALVGAGYAGLPLGLAFCEGGFELLVYDVSPTRVRQLNAGESYIGQIPSQRIAHARSTGKLEATTDASRLAEADAVVICVPTPLDRHRGPDLSYVVQASDAVANALRPGTVVSLESTTYPGTTEEILVPRLQARGLTVGRDVFVVYSSERVDPGNSRFGIENTPKVVGGITPACTEVGSALYGAVVGKVVPVENTRVAEATKLLENIYRSVNIALVNELKMLFDRMDIDVWSVIEAARSKPFGYQPFYPGPGLGGHCIPIDPFYLTWKSREFGMSTRFIELAGEINTAMPQFVVEKVTHALNEHSRAIRGSRILLLGVAYKREVDDVRESPAIAIFELLAKRGADVSFHDPYVAQMELEDGTIVHRDGGPALDFGQLGSADCVVLVTDHSIYRDPRVLDSTRLLVDTRNVFPTSSKVYKA